jgi:hypothetical protein
VPICAHNQPNALAAVLFFIPLGVIAGLAPAIHAAVPQM